jgi:hypothetical protein
MGGNHLNSFIEKSLPILVILGPGLVFGFMGKPTEMGIAIAAGAVAAAFINIDKIQEFKGAGFEAKMKIVVADIYATTENLKQISKPLISSILINLTYGDRIGGAGPIIKHKIRDDLLKLAESLDVSDTEIQESVITFTRYLTWDHLNHFVNLLDSTIPIEIKNKLYALKNHMSDEFPDEKVIKTILGDSLVLLQEKNIEYLNDYTYYKTNKKLRRAEALTRI